MEDGTFSRKDVQPKIEVLDPRALGSQGDTGKLTQELESNSERGHLPTAIGIDHLSSELLVDIWDFNRDCHQWYRDYIICHCSSLWGRASAILQISWVSRRWREVALDSPMLWSDLFISPRVSIELAQLKIERSHSYPLSIRVECSCLGCDTGTQYSAAYHLQKLMEVVTPHIPRWRSIQVALDIVYDYRTSAQVVLDACIMPLSCVSAPYLTDVLISSGRPICLALPQLMEGRLPILTRAQLRNVDIRSTLSTWVGLTCLELNFQIAGGWGLTQMRNLILASPNLAVLILEDPPIQCDWNSPEVYNHPTIVAPSVHSLKYSETPYFQDLDFAHYFLKVFSFPSLETFYLGKVYNFDGLAQDLFDAATKLHAPRFPKLVKLVLDCDVGNPLGFAMVLYGVPTITHLQLRRDHLDKYGECLVRDISWVHLPRPTEPVP